jgi:hypothetical protein
VYDTLLKIPHFGRDGVRICAGFWLTNYAKYRQYFEHEYVYSYNEILEMKGMSDKLGHDMGITMLINRYVHLMLIENAEETNNDELENIIDYLYFNFGISMNNMGVYNIFELHKWAHNKRIPCIYSKQRQALLRDTNLTILLAAHPHTIKKYIRECACLEDRYKLYVLNLIYQAL